MTKSTKLLSIGMLVLFTGCISFTTIIKVKPDGSGHLIQTVSMSAEMANQMKEMQAAFAQQADEEGAEPAPAPELFPVDEAKEKAPSFGEGVTFVEAEPIKTAEAEGLKATYAFTDVTKLNISQQPDAGGMSPSEGEDGEPIRFKFEKTGGGNSLLTAVFPPRDEAEEGEAEGEAEEADAEPDPAEIEQMKQFFQGMKIGIAVEIDGKLVKTSSPYVDGSTVTLMEIEFDKLLEDPEALKKMATDKSKSLEQAKELLKTLPGVKINLDPEVTIEFK